MGRLKEFIFSLSTIPYNEWLQEHFVHYTLQRIVDPNKNFFNLSCKIYMKRDNVILLKMVWYDIFYAQVKHI